MLGGGRRASVARVPRDIGVRLEAGGAQFDLVEVSMRGCAFERFSSFGPGAVIGAHQAPPPRAALPRSSAGIRSPSAAAHPDAARHACANPRRRRIADLSMNQRRRILMPPQLPTLQGCQSPSMPRALSL